MTELIAAADRVEQFTEYLTAVADEAKVHFDGERLWAQPVDPANVAMTRAELDADAFDYYDSADGALLGINLERFEDVMGLADAEALVQIQLNPEIRKLEIEHSGLEYTMALIDPDLIRGEPDLPTLDLPARVVLEARDLKRAVKAADQIAEHVDLGMTADGVFFVEASGDTDDLRYEFADGHGTCVTYQAPRIRDNEIS